jgi:predicted metalloprotease with PDZ domain
MMMTRTMAAVVAAALFFGQCVPVPAHADNQMGYRLLTAQEAATLPRNQGALGLNVERAQQITDGGMTFDLLKITQVRRGSTGAQAGFKTGDTIIAVDGRVFPSLSAFAAYVGSASPGSQLAVDYMPAGGGPQQAQRVAVAVGQAGQAAPPVAKSEAPSPSTGMSTGEKIALGAAAIALFKCYKRGCFSRQTSTATPAPAQ